MASVVGGESSGRGGGRRKKSLDAELNLVPFIDLLSMCICFLLMTAVWIQIGALQVKQTHGTAAPAGDAKGLDLEAHFNSPTQLDVKITQAGKMLRSVQLKADSQPQLIEQLSALFTQLGVPTQNKVSSALLTPDKGVSYGELVTFMDTFRKFEVNNLGVVPVRAR
ncbi:MAG: biopolymer transporter ExbD [Bdellovibrionales bacterium]|nr:biopolymer transporter ExbD [Bdellovibrionales bacterium]